MEICKNMQKLMEWLDSLKIQRTDKSEDYDRWGGEKKIDERTKHK